MEKGIKCSDCKYMKIIGRSRTTGNNSHLSQPRGMCYCRNRDAKAAFIVVCPKSNSMPGFIAFTVRDTDTPDIKTAPRWCPKMLMEKSVEVDKKTAYKIINEHIPHGMFYFEEDSGYTGIDNRMGNTWTKWFQNKSECLKWLKGEEKREKYLDSSGTN